MMLPLGKMIQNGIHSIMLSLVTDPDSFTSLLLILLCYLAWFLYLQISYSVWSTLLSCRQIRKYVCIENWEWVPLSMRIPANVYLENVVSREYVVYIWGHLHVHTHHQNAMMWLMACDHYSFHSAVHVYQEIMPPGGKSWASYKMICHLLDSWFMPPW